MLSMNAQRVFSGIVKTGVYITIFMLAAGLGTYYTVHVLIRSEHIVIVPDLVDKEIVYALEVLSDLGLNTKVKGSQYHPIIAEHHVITQDPAPGTEIKQGRDIRLVISKGPQAVVYPDLIGMDLPQAVISLEQNDLRRGKVSYTYHRQRPREEVLAQFPAGGIKGFRESPVDLLVSAGPRPTLVRMVDLKGLGLESAIDAIEKIHLAVGNITQVDQPDIQDNLVLDHSPGKGYPVLAGGLIDLTINHRVSGTNAVSSRQGTLFRYRAPQGFLRQQARVRIIRPDGAFDIFNDFVEPGEEIWLIVLRDKPTALFLYLEGDLALTKNYD